MIATYRSGERALAGNRALFSFCRCSPPDIAAAATSSTKNLLANRPFLRYIGCHTGKAKRMHGVRAGDFAAQAGDRS